MLSGSVRSLSPVVTLRRSERSHQHHSFVIRANGHRRISMATYIVLSTFTDQGIRSVKDTTKRADAVKETARKMGIETKSIYWTIGKYDVVATFEAPDDASITALSLALASAGNIRTQTMRAFTRDEVNGILAKF
jgi:uncharacterized protein with GYD domain